MNVLANLLFFVSVFGANLVWCSMHEPCPSGLPHTSTVREFQGNCYQFVSQEKYWTGARDYCLKYDGRLAKIADEETNSFITSTLNSLWWNNNGIWIGLHDQNVELQWQWTGNSKDENEPVGRWTNWAPGHPAAFLHKSKDCVRMVRDGGLWKWHETHCDWLNWQYRFICQYKADTLNTVRPPLRVQLSETLPNTTTTISTTTETTSLTSTSSIIVNFMQEFVTYSQEQLKNESNVQLIDLTHFEADGPEEAAILSEKVEQGNNHLPIYLPIVLVFCGASLFCLVVLILKWRRHRDSKLVGSDEPTSANQIKPGKDNLLKNNLSMDTNDQYLCPSNLYIDEEMQRQIKLTHSRPLPSIVAYCPMNAADKSQKSETTYTVASEYTLASEPCIEQQSTDAANTEQEYENGSVDREAPVYDKPRPTNIYDKPQPTNIYDKPQPTNIYEDISDQELDPEAEKDNIYEILEDFQV